jgi:hypothetical protein
MLIGGILLIAILLFPFVTGIASILLRIRLINYFHKKYPKEWSECYPSNAGFGGIRGFDITNAYTFIKARDEFSKDSDLINKARLARYSSYFFITTFYAALLYVALFVYLLKH